MRCRICGTEYIVRVGVKGNGCPNLRNHPRQVRLRVRKLLNKHGIVYVKHLREKLPERLRWKKLIIDSEIEAYKNKNEQKERILKNRMMRLLIK